MENYTLWFSPPILFAIFILLGGLMLGVGKLISAKGTDNPAKFIHYSCGEDLDTPHLELNYHAFFRLAFLFGILHIITLVISTIPAKADIKILPVAYIFGAVVSMLILLERDGYE
ncbi:MAG: hypothetical protein J7L66_05785 [Anaerolineaceae bacterium]|nr:hypothetical protein [Anaerolineaceae bacterium]